MLYVHNYMCYLEFVAEYLNSVGISEGLVTIKLTILSRTLLN